MRLLLLKLFDRMDKVMDMKSLCHESEFNKIKMDDKNVLF